MFQGDLKKVHPIGTQRPGLMVLLGCFDTLYISPVRRPQAGRLIGVPFQIFSRLRYRKKKKKKAREKENKESKRGMVQAIATRHTVWAAQGQAT